MSRIAGITAHPFNVSPRTNWFFVRVACDDGREAWGEASLTGWEPMLEAFVRLKGAELLGQDVASAAHGLRVSALSAGGLVANAVVSALHQALATLEAQALGVSLGALLGQRRHDAVALYANINRATTERTPAGFCAVARRAMAVGITGFKAAPFEGVTPANCTSAEGRARIRHGIDCLAALRDAVGPDARLMADCHWRFDEATALDVLAALRPLRLHWFECPIAEVHANWAALRRIRAAARDEGVLIAAAETQVGREAFETIFAEGLFDVVMPDVKFCGGPREMLAIAERCAAAGVEFSPHNPTGPLCTLATLQVIAAAPQCRMLELQFGESPLYDALMPVGHPPIRDGALAMPEGPGLGATRERRVLDAHPYRPVPFGNETQLFN